MSGPHRGERGSMETGLRTVPCVSWSCLHGGPCKVTHRGWDFIFRSYASRPVTLAQFLTMLAGQRMAGRGQCSSITTTGGHTETAKHIESKGITERAFNFYKR